MFSKRKKDKDKLLENYSLSNDEEGRYNEPEQVSLELQTRPKDEGPNLKPDKTNSGDNEEINHSKELKSVTIRRKTDGRKHLFGWTLNKRTKEESTDPNKTSSCGPSSSLSPVVDLSSASSSDTLLIKKVEATRRDEVNTTKELTSLEEAKKTMALVASNVANTVFVNVTDKPEGTGNYGEDDKGPAEPKENYDDEKRDKKNGSDNKEEGKNDSDKQQDIENDLAHQSTISDFELTTIPEETQEETRNGNIMVLCWEKMFLIMAASTAAIGGILFGYDVGVISGALLQLRQEFHLSCNQQAVLVSFLLLGATLGAIVSGFLVDLLGRKLTILLNGVIFTLGSITVALAKTFYVLVSGRLLLGCAVSISAVAECIYISEIAPAKRRGLLVSLNELGITLGLLISYLVNFLFINVNHGWRYMFGIAAFPAVFQVVAMFFLPKSPRYLLMKGKERQAARILKRLHGQTIMESQLNSIKMALLKEKRFKFKDLFKSNYNMRGRLMLGFGLAFFQQFTGQPNILYYAPVVFQAVGFPSDSAAELATLGLGTVKVTAAIVSLLCVDYWGRRTFLMIGAIAMTISLLLLSIGAQIQEKNFPGHRMCTSWENPTTPSPTIIVNTDHLHKANTNNSFHHYTSFSSSRHKRFVYSPLVQIPHVNKMFCDPELVRNVRNVKSHRNKTQDIGFQNGSLWVPSTTEPSRNSTGKSSESPAFHLIHILTILALMTYVGAYGISFGPITWIILSEIYPPAIRGRAVAIVTVINWAANFIVSSMFLKVINFFTLPGTFYLFTGMSVLSVIFVFFCIPETKNKSLEQISKELSSTKPFKCIWLLKPCYYIFNHFNSSSHNPYSAVSTDDQSSPTRSLSEDKFI